MTPQAPQWTEQEFEVVVQNPGLSNEDLAGLLVSRSVGAVGVVRSGIHSFHQEGRDITMLSEIMRQRLADGTRPVECPRCRAVV